MQDATKPIDSVTDLTKKLRRRLRSIKRFRRETVASRAHRLEAVVAQLLQEALGAPSTDNASAPVTAPSTKIESAREAKSQRTSRCKTAPTPVDHANELQDTPQSSSEYIRVLDLLRHARAEYDELVDYMSTQTATSIQIEETNANSNLIPEFESTIPRPLSNDVPILHRQIEFLEQEVLAAKEETTSRESEVDSLRNQIEILRTQLLESRHESIELRMQNSELTDRLNHQPSASSTIPQSLSWEERKQQLMKQLELETCADTELKAASGNIQAIIETTQREINIRDKQIEELKQLLSNQATVTNGMAVGAAAVAEILDQDELIQQERENLRNLQQEWISKMREAEIEISMERARIARDRLDLQTAIEQANAQANLMEEQLALTSVAMTESNASGSGSHSSASGKPITGRARRWLQRLGLREE